MPGAAPACQANVPLKHTRTAFKATRARACSPLLQALQGGQRAHAGQAAAHLLGGPQPPATAVLPAATPAAVPAAEHAAPAGAQIVAGHPVPSSALIETAAQPAAAPRAAAPAAGQWAAAPAPATAAAVAASPLERPKQQRRCVEAAALGMQGECEFVAAGRAGVRCMAPDVNLATKGPWRDRDARQPSCSRQRRSLLGAEGSCAVAAGMQARPLPGIWYGIPGLALLILTLGCPGGCWHPSWAVPLPAPADNQKFTQPARSSTCASLIPGFRSRVPCRCRPASRRSASPFHRTPCGGGSYCDGGQPAVASAAHPHNCSCQSSCPFSRAGS